MAVKNYQEFLKDIPSDELKQELKRRDSESKEGLHPVAAQIMEELKEAIEEFGAYTFSDKGADEVMDMTTISSLFTNLTIEECATVISQVMDHYENKYIGEQMMGELVMCLDHRADFDDLFQYDDRFEY